MDDAEVLDPGTASGWGAWLAEHHERPTGVWLTLRDRTAAGHDALSYEASVLEALCWGWIDAQVKPLPDGGNLQWFSPRRASSPWASSNKARVLQLEAEGRMQDRGRRLIAEARANGMWEVLEGPEAGIEPPELARRLDADPSARAFWDALPPSSRKGALTSVALARREATRAARIAKIVDDCAVARRPF